MPRQTRHLASLLAVGLLCLMGAAACTPTSSYEGFQAVDKNPGDVKVGEDTRASVLAKLGSPTASSTFDKNTWFYMTQVASKTAFYRPRVTRRDVVAIDFDKATDQVAAINTYTLKDGRVVAYNGRQTPTRGREMTFLEELFGNIGSVSTLPQPDVSPGTHPGDRGP